MLEGKDFVILEDDEAKLMRYAALKYLSSMKGEEYSLEDHLISNLCRGIKDHLSNEV